jgi:hypothetical protein
MPKFPDISPESSGQHSFLFWLVVPLVMVWFSASYLFGSFTDHPLWLQSNSSVGSSSKIVPYLNTLPDLPAAKTGYITLWFDDAWLSQYLIAFPLFQKYNFPGVIAVPSSAIETPEYMNWAQLQVLQKSGWEITNHSVSHDCQMYTWSAEKVRQEYRASKLSLWRHQLSSDILVTPCGVDSRAMRDEAAKSFFAYRTVNPGINDLSNFDPYEIKVRNTDNQTTVENIKKWIDEAQKRNTWVVLIFHQLGKKNSSGDSDKYNMSADDLASIIDYISQSKIPVITPGQIIAAFVK